MSKPPEPLLPQPGDRWGHYRIERALGSGGMGTVFAAKDELLDRLVAVKLLHGAIGEEALLAEARALASLNHENIVRVYELVRGARPFVVMEYVEGQSYEQLLLDKGPLSPSAAVEVIDAAARALTAIHRVGRIHGDVKPSNILRERSTGRVLLTDFGLSQRIEDLQPADLVRGTPGYLAPERAARTYSPPHLRVLQDVYSLAATAYDLLTARPPFVHDNLLELLRKQAFEDPPLPSAVRPTLSWRIDRALMRGLRRKPAHRTPTPVDFARDLAEAVARGSAAPRILLADDDVDHHRLVSHAFAKRIGRVVIEATADGERALEAASARTPDLAILDLDMPGMNGIELAAAMRTTEGLERVPIVIVSGRLGPAERGVLERLGVEACFEKPVLMWRLVSAALELLGPVDRSSGLFPRADIRRRGRGDAE